MIAASIAVIIGNVDRWRARLRNELDRAEWAGVRAAPTGSQRYANRGRRRDPVVTITNRRGLDAYLRNRRPRRRHQIGCRGDRERVLADPSGIVRVNRRHARDDGAWWRRATFVTVRLRCGWRNRGQQRAQERAEKRGERPRHVNAPMIGCFRAESARSANNERE